LLRPPPSTLFPYTTLFRSGAGIQRDLKTFAALGVDGCAVLTALTAQNETGIRAIHFVPADFVTQQIDAVFSGGRVSAVKLGMLGDRKSTRLNSSHVKNSYA